MTSLAPPKWVALLRGINVGGHNKVPMGDLRQIAQALGWGDVVTYVASGNLVFSAWGVASDLGQTLQIALFNGLNVDAATLVLSAQDFAAIKDQCPFTPDDPRQVHALFAFGTPTLDHDVITRFVTASEVVTQIDGTVWLHTPQGYGTSKLAGRMDRVLGCDVTARNLRSVQKIAALAAG